MAAPSIVCISGTGRPDNYTSKALAVVHDELEKKGVTPTVFDARTMTLAFPGEPPTEDAKALRAAIEDAAGVILATPEYHGSFSAMTKLIIENLGFPSVLADKPIALVGVASGRIGAIKSLEQLRGVCSHVGGIVLPFAVSVAGVRGAFDADGACTDEQVESALQGVADSLLDFVASYICPRFALESAVRGDGKPWTTTV